MTEQAEREVLEALFTKLHDGKSARWLDHYGEPGLSAKGRRFNALMGLNAYLDAALMLAPEGWTLFHLSGPFSNTTCKATIAGCEPPKFKEGEGGTRALALCAAIEAALARGGE